MTSGIGIDGLISGLNTTEIIDKLIAVEANQQTLLATKKSNLQSLATALQSLNTKVASLATAAGTAARATSWQATTATSTATGVTATTSEGAQPSSVTLSVEKLAASQSTLYTLPSAYTGDQPTFELTVGGETTTITALSPHIGDIVAAFNAEGTGVTAAAVNVGTKDAPVYRLQLTGTETGKDNLFSLTATNQSTATGETPLGEQTLRAAADAEIILWPGTAGATKVTSATNTFEGLLTGVDITVSAVTTDPATVSVTRDAKAVSSLASSLVTNLNAVLGDIADRTKAANGTADDGSAILKGGLFSGNTTIRLLQQSLLTAGSSSAAGSLADLGIVLGRDGTFTFDSEKFATAYATDPEGVQKTVQGVAAQLESTAKAASDATDGTLTAQIATNKDEVDDLADRIADWDTRLTARRAALVKLYTAMEVSMSQMQSTSNFLSQQIAQLNANSSAS